MLYRKQRFLFVITNSDLSRIYKKNILKIYHGWALCDFVSFENDNVECLIRNRKIRKKEKTQNLSPKGWKNLQCKDSIP